MHPVIWINCTGRLSDTQQAVFRNDASCINTPPSFRAAGVETTTPRTRLAAYVFLRPASYRGALFPVPAGGTWIAPWRNFRVTHRAALPTALALGHPRTIFSPFVLAETTPLQPRFASFRSFTDSFVVAPWRFPLSAPRAFAGQIPEGRVNH